MRNFLMSDVPGSPLPGFDNIVAQASQAVNDSPVVDRALDSALDFLQKGDPEFDEDEDDEFDMFDIFEDSPDIEIPYDLISELEEKENYAQANRVPHGSDINAAAIQEAVVRWRRHDKDCGSMEVQVAILNERVKYLTKHLLSNKHDVATRRGLNSIVTARRKCLNYLYEHDQAKAEEMTKALGIRFRPPGQLWDKGAKYGAFTNTKSKYMKIRAEKKAERKARADKVSA